MGGIETVGSHAARLLPRANAGTLRRLERAAQQRTFRRRDLLHARGIALPPFVVLDGHVMDRRVAETGQVYAALIAGPGYLGGLRSISDPDAEAFYELVALTDGTWATWDPRFMRELALEDAGLSVGLLDQASDFAFDTPHPVARRADLAAMIGTSRVMMGRALRELEADGLVKREPGGGIRILDEKRLAQLIAVASPDGAPAL
jgi:hypothetical protein